MKTKKKLILILLSFVSLHAYCFDIEDYANVYRQTRDAYAKAATEYQLAWPVYEWSKQVLENRGFVIHDEPLITKEGLRTGSCLGGENHSEDGTIYGLLNKKYCEKFGDGGGCGNSIPSDQTTAERQHLGTALKNLILHGDHLVLHEDGKAVMYQMLDEFQDWNDQRRADHDQGIIDHLSSYLPQAMPVKDPAKVSMCPLSDPSTEDDLITSHLAVRDAMIKAQKELYYATAPYKAARDTWTTASKVFAYESDCFDPKPWHDFKNRPKWTPSDSLITY